MDFISAIIIILIILQSEIIGIFFLINKMNKSNKIYPEKNDVIIPDSKK